MRTKENPVAAGYRSGDLCVERATQQRKNGYTVWLCRCVCGGEILLDTRALQRGAVHDCGCKSRVKPGQRDLTGMRFGRLTALCPTDGRSANGAIVWRCRCDCGNIAEAAATQLTKGVKKSCGCLGRGVIHDYTGRRFGMLTVLAFEKSENHRKYWRCRCDCGRETVAEQTMLSTGRTTHCGCVGALSPDDLTGMRFGRLLVQSEDSPRDGRTHWLCRCACGNQISVSHWNLLSGKTGSCGCLLKEQIRENLQLVDGTSITRLKSTRSRLLSSNKSGVSGVYQDRRTGKWAAQITFKGKTHYLGSYADFEDAVKARQRGEEMHDAFLEAYEKNVR